MESNILTELAQIGNRLDPKGAISFPIYHSSTFRHPGLGESTGFDYSRTANPTRQVLEDAIARLEEGTRGYAFSSGMGAITTILALFSHGDHLIVTEDLYGGTYRILDEVFNRFGLHVSFVDTSNLEEIEKQIFPNTKAIFSETPTNPLMKIADLRGIASLAQSHGLLNIVDNTFLTPFLQKPVSFVDTTQPELVRQAINSRTKALFIETPSNPLLKITDLREMIKISKEYDLLTIVDNTFLTPYYCRPLELGADIVLHSAIKFLNGHSDVVAGLAVARSDELAQRISFLQNAFGAVLGPQDAWLLIRGLKNLGIRLERQSENALILAKWLESQPWVSKVFYPGLSQHEGRSALEALSTGYGAILSFEVKEPHILHRILREMELPAVGVSLGAVETILTHPATMSHASIPKEERTKLGITDNLLRLSVGLEDSEDLIHDFEALL